MRKNNSPLLFVLCADVALGTIVFIIQNQGNNTLFQRKDRTTTKEAVEVLTPEEYQRVRENLAAIMKNQNPARALTQLREEMKNNDSLARSCHALVHDIGRRAYEKYEDFAIAIQYHDEICNSGYLHGIIERYFSKSVDLSSTMETVCEGYPRDTYISWECYHGVGHGAMYYTSNDLPRSLGLCEMYEPPFAKAACANGVFMENFNTDQTIHPSRFLKASDPFYPCQEQPSRYKRDCYLYAPTYYLGLHPTDYSGALRWCTQAETPYQHTCAQGVGSQAMKENINRVKSVEKICMSGASSQTSPCINGMVSLYINHYGSLEPARKLCEELRTANRQSCQSSIQSSSGLF